jgi:hypothetical protein
MSISEAAIEVLDRSVIDGNTLRLPGAQLPRKLYEEVNEVLTRLGAKWNRKAGGHVFDDGDVETVRTVAASGEMPPKNPMAFFPTPAPVVDQMLALAGEDRIGAAQRLLEPSAGDGAILGRIVSPHPWGRVVHAVEVDARRCARLRTQGFAVEQADFLTWEPNQPDTRYDAVLMNPPFTAPGDPLAYIPHIMRAHSLLAPGGVLVSVAPNGFTYRTDRRSTAFREFVEQHGEWLPLPPQAFTASGTGVSCVLVHLTAPSDV